MPYKDKEKQRQNKREYYWKNREKILLRKRIYSQKPDVRKRRREYFKKRWRKWRIKHPLKKRERKPKKQRRLKLRFQVFQRDNFTCQYCGRKAPECILEIDHRFPKSKGGRDNIKNYITSCQECNLGKGDSILEEFKNCL